MAQAQPGSANDFDTIARMPSRITLARAESLEDVAFVSGAALVTLDIVMRRPEVPHGLLRDRLALRAAEACVAAIGRPERAAELRDEVHLLRPGERPGPAGEVYLHWHRAVARKPGAAQLAAVLPEHLADQVPAWLKVGDGSPVGQAAQVLQAVLEQAPREEVAALILADAVLARAMGWDRLLPLLAHGLKSRDLRKVDEALRLACHRAVVGASGAALRMASDLARRRARLQEVRPKLRAKGADRAVEMFLCRDALSPSVTLTGWMSDRAARRCATGWWTWARCGK